MATPLIAAQAIADSLRPVLRQAELDREAFARPLARCVLSECRATCCHDGVVLDSAEVSVLETCWQTHRDRIQAYGIAAGETWWERDARGRPKIATAPASAAELAEDFPAHFPKTRCVFLDADHRCAWQRLADDLGLPSWFYKPVSCWMHPIALLPGTPPRLTLAGNPQLADDFASHTPCGESCAQGRPAKDILASELTLLGQIAGRDFVGEALD